MACCRSLRAVITLASATFTVGLPQKDSRHYVTETITLDDGSPPSVTTYLAEPDEDYQAHLDAMCAAAVERANAPPNEEV